jgi:diguanylate cyclase (GGDEF)-like protein/PAS domain S-box-containing protein
MKPRLSSSEDATKEVAASVETPNLIKSRLVELTTGQVDAVVDGEDRTLLLQRTQEQLVTNEAARQVAILNALPAHIALLDTKGNIVSVNEAWRQFTGANVIQGSGDSIGVNYLEICDNARGDGASDAHLVAEGIRSVLSGEKKSFSAEYPCHSPTEQRWFQLLVTPLREDHLFGAVVMHVNITERKELERTAQLNQKRLRDLIDGLGPSMFVGLMTPQGILIEANRPALAAAGLKPIDVLGKPFAETYWWAYSPEIQRQLRDAIIRAAHGEPSRYDVQVHAGQGHLIDCDFSLQPVLDETGKVVLLVPSASVITERKQTERALQESEGKYRALVQWSPESIILTRLGKILFLNPAAVRMTGAGSEQDLIGKSILEIVHPDFRQIVQARLKNNTKDGGHLPLIEERLVKLDGTVIDVEVQGRSIIYDGEPATFSSLRDITEYKRAAEALRQSEERLSLLIHGVRDYAIFMLDPEGLVTTWNEGAERIKGYAADEIIGQHFSKFYTPEDLAQGMPSRELRIAREQERSEEEGWRVRKNGSRFWADVVITPLRDKSGQLRGFGKVTRDITERKQAEDTLFAERESAQVRLNSIGDSVFCADVSGNINYLNSVAERFTGWSLEEAAGKPVAEVLRIKDAKSGEIVSNELEKAIGQAHSVQLPSDGVFVRRDGIEIPVEGSVAPIHDHDGELAGAVIVVRDVSEARTMAQQISHLAEHDALTGLPNRLLLNDRASQAIGLASRNNKRLALLFLDLDGFKHINDSLGHPTGDKLLQSIAKALVGCVRAADTVSRQGGDEFVVLLSEMEHPEDVAITAKRMLEAVAEPHFINLRDLHVTASIGLSAYPDDGLDAETLVKNADTAMYQAKENGRHGYQFFKPAMNVRAVERQSIEEDLRRALERGEFVLNYQPKVNLRTGEITGAEALIRWTHPTRGPVSPAQFIPVAEECGLILPMGKWVLREACKQARVWADTHTAGPTIAVNVSAIEFRQENFQKDLFSILTETGLDPRSLELELTETVLMKRAESVESVLQELRARGVQVAVDDFGTGYSSLSYLRKFPIDALKIDQSFVRQITTPPHDTTIVSAIISMGRSMNLRVIAEGVETFQELSFLQAHECDEAQGYYFSRPVPADQFAQLLETGIPETALH